MFGGLATTSDVLLYVGSRGDQVSQIQRALNQIMGTNLTEDGIFGSQTQQAVRSYQSYVGLDADGVVGPMTWQALMVEGKSRPNFPTMTAALSPEMVYQLPIKTESPRGGVSMDPYEVMQQYENPIGPMPAPASASSSGGGSFMPATPITSSGSGETMIFGMPWYMVVGVLGLGYWYMNQPKGKGRRRR